MLTSLKQFASSWVSQLLLGLLVLSFAVWGIADIFTGFGAGAVATVGKSEVSLVDFQRRYESTMRLLQRQTGTAISPQQAAQFGVPSQVLGSLVGEATLDDLGLDMGLGISNEGLSRRIKSDPNLVGPSGIYSESYLRQLVNGQGFSLDDFVEARRAEYLREQITDAFAGGIAVPEAFLRAVTEYTGETRTIDYVLIAPPPLSRIADPTDAELTPFHAERSADWRAPELRGLRYAALTREAIARPRDIAAEEVRKRFDSQIQRFSAPERRRIDQIVFDTAEEAEAAAAELSSGTAFDQVASTRNLTAADVAFGVYARADIADDGIGEAAFGLETGGTSGVILGRFGPVIIRVSEIQPGTVQAFEDVDDSIRNELANELAAAEIDDLHDAIEDARAGGSTLSDIASRFALPLGSVAAIDASGNNEDGAPVSGLPEPSLVSAAFQSDVGLENDPLRVGGDTFIWYEVTAVTAPRDRPLTEVRDRVAAAWKDAKREEQAETDAAEIFAELEAGKRLANIADERGLTVATAEGVNRGSAAIAGLSAAGVRAAFDGPEGHAAVVAGNDPLERLVISVSGIETPAFFSGAPDMAQTEAQLSRQIAAGLIQLYITEAQADRDIVFNNAVLNQIFAGQPVGTGR